MPQAVDITTNALQVGNPDPQPRTISPLLRLLSTTLVLDHIVPYLSAADRLNLSAASQDFRHLVLRTPGVFRHLDLTAIKAAQFDVEATDHGDQVWRNVQLDEYLTDDDFYGGPLRGIFSNLKRRDLLADVQTLILDGLSVTAELCHEIIHDPAFSVRVLSLRGAKNLNEKKLCGSLRHACRPSRPEGTPRLKALYILGPHVAPLRGNCHGHAREFARALSFRDSLRSSEWNSVWGKARGEDWYHLKGRMLSRPMTDEWATTLVDCHGIIAFDALPCRGPRHLNSPAFGKIPAQNLVTPLGTPRDTQWAVAEFALGPCAGCGAAPEGLISHTSVSSPAELPLLAPPPRLASSLKACTTPSLTCAAKPTQQSSRPPPFAARCFDCLRDRYCIHCTKWWCEDCYVPPTAPAYQQTLQTTDVVIVSPDGDAWVQQHVDEGDRLFAPTKPKARIIKSCWECGDNCHDCIEQTQLICRGCRGGYCITHNEGSSSTHCDWCTTRGARGRFLRHL